jgi:hypothetical protein
MVMLPVSVAASEGVKFTDNVQDDSGNSCTGRLQLSETIWKSLELVWPVVAAVADETVTGTSPSLLKVTVRLNPVVPTSSVPKFRAVCSIAREPAPDEGVRDTPLAVSAAANDGCLNRCSDGAASNEAALLGADRSVAIPRSIHEALWRWLRMP